MVPNLCCCVGIGFDHHHDIVGNMVSCMSYHLEKMKIHLVLKKSKRVTIIRFIDVEDLSRYI